jgi:hypothetical protein
LPASILFVFLLGNAAAAQTSENVRHLSMSFAPHPQGAAVQTGQGPEGQQIPGMVMKGPWLRMTGDFLEFEHRPSFSTLRHQLLFRTNKWGMRDKEYSLRPPAHTYRIALIGASVEVGAGVAAEKNYESLTEERLNVSGPHAGKQHYEILNFAVGSYSILQQVFVVEHKVLRFSPKLILLAIHSVEPRPTIRHLIGLVNGKPAIPYPYVQEKLRVAGVQPGMADPELRRRLATVAKDLTSWSYKQIAELARERGIRVVAVLVPRADREFLATNEEPVLAEQARMAADAGMQVISLEGAFDGQPRGAVRLPPPDQHPNELGHALLARRLYDLLLANNARLLNAGLTPRD